MACRRQDLLFLLSLFLCFSLVLGLFSPSQSIFHLPGHYSTVTCSDLVAGDLFSISPSFIFIRRIQWPTRNSTSAYRMNYSPVKQDQRWKSFQISPLKVHRRLIFNAKSAVCLELNLNIKIATRSMVSRCIAILVDQETHRISTTNEPVLITAAEGLPQIHQALSDALLRRYLRSLTFPARKTQALAILHSTPINYSSPPSCLLHLFIGSDMRNLGFQSLGLAHFVSSFDPYGFSRPTSSAAVCTPNETLILSIIWARIIICFGPFAAFYQFYWFQGMIDHHPSDPISPSLIRSAQNSLQIQTYQMLCFFVTNGRGLHSYRVSTLRLCLCGNLFQFLKISSLDLSPPIALAHRISSTARYPCMVYLGPLDAPFPVKSLTAHDALKLWRELPIDASALTTSVLFTSISVKITSWYGLNFPSKSSPSSSFLKERTLLPHWLSWRGQSSSGTIPRDHSSICTILLSFLACTALEEATDLLWKMASDGKCYYSKSKHMMYVTTRFLLWGLAATSLSTHLSYTSNPLSSSFKEILSVSTLFVLEEYCSNQRGCLIPSSLCNIEA